MEQCILDEKEKNIYLQYQNVIDPFIAELEVRDKEYPIEIFNEIRAIFTHLARYKIQKNEKDVLSAEKHVKRAILDCYKYLCFSIAEQIHKFRIDYRTVDLKLADNGKFLPQLNKLDSLAQKALQKAEIKNEVTEEDLYIYFEDIYNAYSELDKFIENSNEAIAFASFHSKKNNWITIISIIITIISIVIALVPIVMG